MVVVEGEEMGKILLDGLLVAENGRLVVHDYAHISLERPCLGSC